MPDKPEAEECEIAPMTKIMVSSRLGKGIQFMNVHFIMAMGGWSREKRNVRLVSQRLESSGEHEATAVSLLFHSQSLKLPIFVDLPGTLVHGLKGQRS